MSKESKVLKLVSIFIVIISLFYAAKVWWFKKELRSLLNEQKSEHFEVLNVRTFFGIKDFTRQTHYIVQENKTISYNNVPYIHIDAQIKNLTGDDIEYAELMPELNIEFKYGQKILTLDYSIVNYGEKWRANQTLIINQDFLISSPDNEYKYDTKFMEYHPKKVELQLSIKASNSVGLDMNDIVFVENIDSWDRK